MTRRLAVFAATLLLAVNAFAFELTHSTGTLKLPTTPSAVVVYDLAALDSLNVLGAKIVGVPKSTYQGTLAAFAATPTVGTLFEPDYEALKTVKPDLIVAGGRSRRAMDKLSEVAPTVIFSSDPTHFMADFRKTNLALGHAFGKEQQAEKAVKAVEGDVDSLHKANKGKTGVMLFVNGGNINAQTTGDRFGYLYELTGLKSVLPAKDPNAPDAAPAEAGSPEAGARPQVRAQVLRDIAAANPDWIVVLDRGAINNGEKTAATLLAKHPDLSKTAAFKAGRVHYVSPNGWYVVGGGLANLKTETAALLASMNK